MEATSALLSNCAVSAPRRARAHARTAALGIGDDAAAVAIACIWLGEAATIAKGAITDKRHANAGVSIAAKEAFLLAV